MDVLITYLPKISPQKTSHSFLEITNVTEGCICVCSGWKAWQFTLWILIFFLHFGSSVNFSSNEASAAPRSQISGVTCKGYYV